MSQSVTPHMYSRKSGSFERLWLLTNTAVTMKGLRAATGAIGRKRVLVALKMKNGPADGYEHEAYTFDLISCRNRPILDLLLTRLTRRKASVGLFFGRSMPVEPAVKRAIAFVDGQNLFHNARNAFGYTYPNYDVQKLAHAVCASRGWTLERVQFYTAFLPPQTMRFGMRSGPTNWR